MEPTNIKSVGAFTVKGVLGKGGCATVYRVTSPASDRDLALKLLNVTLSADNRGRKRFRNEIEFLKELDHPNIVRVCHAGHHERRPFYTLEFVDGRSLDKLIAESIRTGRHPKPCEVNTVCRDLLSALSYLEERELIHRDIKPANLIVDGAGRGHLSDFGMARLKEVTRLTQSGVLLGTLGYMSPEQLRGEDPDCRSDIYQCGLLLYEMVFLTRPFAHLDPPQQLMMRSSHELPLDEIEVPHGFEGIKAVIARACAVKVADRYPSATEMSQALAVVAAANEEPDPTKVRPSLEKTVLNVPSLVPERGSSTVPSRGLLNLSRPALAIIIGLAALIGMAVAPYFERPDLARLVAQELAAGKPERAVLLVHTSITGLGPANETPAAMSRRLASLVTAIGSAFPARPHERKLFCDLVKNTVKHCRRDPMARAAITRLIISEAKGMASSDGNGALELLELGGAELRQSKEGILLLTKLHASQGALTKALELISSAAGVPELPPQLAIALTRKALEEDRIDLAALLFSSWSASEQAATTSRIAIADGLLRRGKKGDLIKARDLFARKSMEQIAEYLVASGRVHKARKEYDRALAAFHRADDLSPSLGTKRALGAMYSQLGREVDALDAYIEAVRLDPQDPSVQVHVFRRRWPVWDERLEALLRKIKARDPKRARALLGLTKAYDALDTNDVEAARALALQAAKAFPDEPLTTIINGRILAREGPLEAWRKNNERGLTLFPDSHRLMCLDGAYLERMGKSKQAMKRYLDAMKSHPASPEPGRRLLGLVKATGLDEEVNDQVGAFLAGLDEMNDKYLILCYTAVRSRRFGPLIGTLDRIIRMMARAPEAHLILHRASARYHRLVAYCALGRWERALDLTNECLRDLPLDNRLMSPPMMTMWRVTRWRTIKRIVSFLRSLLEAIEAKETACQLRYEFHFSGFRDVLPIPLKSFPPSKVVAQLEQRTGALEKVLPSLAVDAQRARDENDMMPVVPVTASGRR